MEWNNRIWKHSILLTLWYLQYNLVGYTERFLRYGHITCICVYYGSRVGTSQFTLIFKANLTGIIQARLPVEQPYELWRKVSQESTRRTDNIITRKYSRTELCVYPMGCTVHKRISPSLFTHLPWKKLPPFWQTTFQIHFVSEKYFD